MATAMVPTHGGGVNPLGTRVVGGARPPDAQPHHTHVYVMFLLVILGAASDVFKLRDVTLGQRSKARIS